MPRTYVYTEFGGADKEMFVDLPRPIPGEGQLLISVRAAGVNPRDWKERAGLYGTSGSNNGPTPMGSEAAGIVVEVGTNVDGFVVGDPVFGSVVGHGAFSQYTLLDAREAAHKPKQVSFIEAATLPVAAATAYAGERALQLQPGETLLIIGIGGGVGLAAAQFAIAEGARVIGTASATKRDLIESIGATHVVYGEGTLERLRAVAPNGVDAIFDMVGGDAMRELGGLVSNGRIVAAATPAAAIEFGGTKVGRSRDSSVLDAVAMMITAGSFKPLITEVFPFDQVGDALARMETGHASGKIVVEVAGDDS